MSEREALRLTVSALEQLLEKDPHDLGDDRPCATCDYAKGALRIGRDILAARAPQTEETTT